MRSAGILLHISSLPNQYGIGTLGNEAYVFIDFLKKSNQKYWQVLPINPTSYGDSPYQSFCSFAGNPYFIDLDILESEGLLLKEEYGHLSKCCSEIDYESLFMTRFIVLEQAYERFKNLDKKEEFEIFKINNQYWLLDYALFMSIKENFNNISWLEWPKEFQDRHSEVVTEFYNNNIERVEFWIFVQYVFYKQWDELKTYANNNSIEIIGDMPIYTALDSADCWARPYYWQLDENYQPIAVAGVPPDLFSQTGQLWGNPLYDYKKMKKDSFSWWIERIKQSKKLFDFIRIDHFRGFESYYSIPYRALTAEKGIWIKGPGYSLFSEIHKRLGDVKIIAEDLGLITPEVRNLLAKCKYPGMKILQFGFDPFLDSLHAPHHHNYNSIVYPGTHDNPPIKAWYSSLKPEEREYVNEYLQIKQEEVCEIIIKECLKSVCKIAIIPMQDYLEQDSRSRMNTPSTLGGNWVYRINHMDLSDELAYKIRLWTNLYRR